MTAGQEPGPAGNGVTRLLAGMAVRLVLLACRDAFYDAAIGIVDDAGRAAAVARAQGIEDAAAVIEAVLRHRGDTG